MKRRTKGKYYCNRNLTRRIYIYKKKTEFMRHTCVLCVSVSVSGEMVYVYVCGRWLP